MAKVVVITGAGVGLGRALARRFAEDGDRVVLLGRTLSKVEAVANEIGDRALAIGCDVGNPHAVRTAFEDTKAAFGKVDVLINNAAIFLPFLLKEATDDEILSLILTNLAGTIFCSREVVPMMSSGAHIINVSSESVEMPFPHLSVYQSTKAAVERFTQSLFRELEPEGIRVSCVRAGTMYEEGKVWYADPQAQLAFGKAAMERGIDLKQMPVSHYRSVTNVFRALVDLPDDLHLVLAQLHGRKV